MEVCAFRSLAIAASRSAFATRGSSTLARPSPASLPPRASTSQGLSSSVIFRFGSAASHVSRRTSPLRELLRHRGDRRVLLEDRRDDAGRDEAVQGLLGALVRVVDEVRQRLEHRVEELRVDRDDHLLVDERRVAALRQVLEAQLLPLPFAQRDEARLDEVHPARQDRQRPQLAVGEAPRRRRHLERDRADAWRSRQEEGLVRAAARRDVIARLVSFAERPKRAERSSFVSGSRICEREAPLQLAFRRVVDDDLQLGPVPLAQEARDVGTDHQLLDALRLLLQRARRAGPSSRRGARRSRR